MSKGPFSEISIEPFHSGSKEEDEREKGKKCLWGDLSQKNRV